MQVSTRPGVWGSGEIRAHYGISRPTLQDWRKHPDFPQPQIINAGRTAVWHRADIETWAHTHGKQPLRKRTRH